MNQEPIQRVLVLDGSELSTLAIVRSLGRNGLAVTLASEQDAHKPIAGYSKYVDEVFFYSDPLGDPEQFVAEIISHLQQNRYDLVIPVTDKTVVPLAKHKQVIEQHALLASPGFDILEQTTDKNATFALAESLDIPVPKSITVLNLAGLAEIEPQLTYPVVIKPSRSIAGAAGDIRIKLNVQYAFSNQELIKKCTEILPYTPVVLQEYFVGDGIGVEILADHGEIVYAFQHKRLHEMPLTGGGSCLRESVAVNPQLLAYSQGLIQAINWHGVAMVEFKYCENTNESRLIEINGRFWGSLPLAVSAGADFPYYLYQLLVLNRRTLAPPAVLGARSRKLKDDIYWYLVVLLRKENSPLVIWPTIGQLLRDILSVFSRHHHIDSFAIDDLKPGLVDAYRTVKWLYDMAYGPLKNRLQKIAYQWRKTRGSINKQLPTAKNVLFLCYGNINRSSLAETCLLQYLAGQGKNITVSSAGFHPKENRPADPNMVAIAQGHGLDLSHWSSHRVTEKMLADADLVLVMEIKHGNHIKEKFPSYHHKVHLLGAVTTDASTVPLEIADPYAQSPEIYQRCFQQVNAACRIIADLLN
ncbi:MAG: ATP-grasp domain-containing protein [Methylococcales bacterium]|nr:ATP-grasp domain-containing protein [Methylococcales bacterium]